MRKNLRLLAVSVLLAGIPLWSGVAADVFPAADADDWDYVPGKRYGGCYQQYNADFSLAGHAFMAWPVTNCGVNPPVCASGFTPVVNFLTQGNSATAGDGWNFLNLDVYWTSWACAKQ